MPTIAERMEALKVAHGGGEVALGGAGASATATPAGLSGTAGPGGKVGEVEEAANVSGFKPQYGTVEETAPTEPADESCGGGGEVLAAGWLKKSGKGLKAKVFEPRWVVLSSDPALAFFEDETLKVAKGDPLNLAGGTVKRENEFVSVSIPEEIQTSTQKRFQLTKLQADTEPEADSWVARIEAAIAGEPQPSS